MYVKKMPMYVTKMSMYVNKMSMYATKMQMYVAKMSIYDKNTPLGASKASMTWLIDGNCGRAYMGGCRLRKLTRRDNIMPVISHVWHVPTTLGWIVPGIFCSWVDFRGTISGDRHECVESRRISWKSAHVTHVQRRFYLACRPGSDIRGSFPRISRRPWSTGQVCFFIISLSAATTHGTS